MFGFGKQRKAAQEAKEAERNRKVTESQHALLAAAIATADVAQDVTQNLKKKLDDIVKQFESTARILKDALIICNAEGRITTFNPAAERMFGIKARDALRKPIVPLFEGREEEIQDAAHLWSLVQNDDHSDVLGKNADGDYFPIQVSLSLLDRSDGSNAVMLLVHDITPDNAVKAVETHYQTLFETSFDGIVIVLTDGCLAAANPAVSRLFGHPVATLMGKPITTLVSPKDHDRLLACQPKPGRARVDLPQHFVVEGVHSTGKLLDLVFTLTQIQWEGQNAVLATIKDMTEMRRLENMVAMKRDNGIDMVCCFDPTYRVTFANRTFAASLGQKRRDLVGMDIRDLLGEDEREAFTQGIASLSPGVPAHRSQVVTTDASGCEIVKDWIDHATFDADGRIIEYQRVGRDIAGALCAVKRG